MPRRSTSAAGYYLDRAPSLAPLAQNGVQNGSSHSTATLQGRTNVHYYPHATNAINNFEITITTALVAYLKKKD